MSTSIETLASDSQRARMVEQQIAARGLRDERVLAALRRVRREHFVPAESSARAFEDAPLPIGGGQTISQPYICALMLQLLELRGNERVLEIGTGSGYAAALLAELAREVISLERDERLARMAALTLSREGVTHVTVLNADGSQGWPERAPYDAISVAAAAEEVPQALLDQLAPGGRLVLPLGSATGPQELVRVRKQLDGRITREYTGAVRFVPLLSGLESEGSPTRPGDEQC